MPAAGAGPLSRVTVQNPSTGGSTGTQNVNVQNFPATQAVSGIVSATQSGQWNVAVNNFPTTQTVAGSVSVSNFPATQQVSDAGGSLTVDTPQLPTTLGAKTAANSVSVAPATDATFTTIDRGSPSIATGQVAVTQGAVVQVVPARAGRRKITLSPASSIPYVVGTTGVTATTGFAVLSGGAVTLDTTAAISVIAGNNGTMTFVETF